ncbi:MAG: alpha-L-fucosidase [Bacteroidota bacterium]
MRNKIVFTVALILLQVSSLHAQKKLRRSESFFGFHFDFHAVATDKELGKNFDTLLLNEFLARTKPDFIQVDSKGHFGFSSYPTKVGYSPNSFVQDPMRLWKAAADKHHLSLYVHYSGIRDDEAMRRNPGWARVKADGTRDSTRAGYLSPYSEKLLIPQLKEMIDAYQIDGAWVDGECWAALPDYSQDMQKGFLKETGLKQVPLNEKDTLFEKWKDYNRNAFKKYLRNYTDQLHKYRPDFQITSNWAYSSRMPEPVDANLDFLSGDIAGTNCVYSAAFEARCLALQGKPWDLMSWGFFPLNFWGGTHTTKPVVQLKQEAAETMAVGGGYQVYFQQNRDAGFQTVDVDAMEELAKFCRDRQRFCQQSTIIPHIGIWYSLAGWKEAYRDKQNVYGSMAFNTGMKGITSLLLDAGQPVEILMDHHLKEQMEKYSLIVIPEWVAFDPEIKTQLLRYTNNGGNLLVIGAGAAGEFRNVLEVEFIGEVQTAELITGAKDLGGMAGIKTRWQQVRARKDSSVIGNIFSRTDYRYVTPYAPASINAYRKGKIAAIYMDLSAAQQQYRNPVFNNLLRKIIAQLIPEPVLKVEGSAEVHTVLAKKNDHTLVHLINSGGHHSNEKVFGYTELRPTPMLTVSVRSLRKPKEVILQPYGKKLDAVFSDGYIRFSVPPVAVYDIVEISFN